MSVYQSIVETLSKFVGMPTLFRWGFNLSPMYRRSTGRIVSVSDDLLRIRVRVPISWRNRNYVNSIFGGSLFSAVDPIPMVQLMNLLGKDYVVWDKSAEVFFKRPAKQDVYADFEYSAEELDSIRARVASENEITVVKTSILKDADHTSTFCEVRKTLYVADKVYYIQKLKSRKTLDRSTAE